MESRTEPVPLVVIVGETASGKSSLAIELARQFNGEIIAADSRTVYKGMDIGTAKPSKADQARITHYLLDVVTPDERFTVGDFKRLAEVAIDEISDRGKLPILVGGTGLYIDSVLFNYQFSDAEAPRDSQNPRHLAKLDLPKAPPSPDQLTLADSGLPSIDVARATSPSVKPLSTLADLPWERAILRKSSKTVESRRSELRPNTLILGLDIDKEALKEQIILRIEVMMEAGLVEEVKKLVTAYGEHVPALSTPGYKPVIEYLNGTISLEEAKTLFIKNDLNLAKRQRTWFKRNKSIQWIKKQIEAVELTTTFLNKNSS